MALHLKYVEQWERDFFEFFLKNNMSHGRDIIPEIWQASTDFQKQSQCLVTLHYIAIHIY